MGYIYMIKNKINGKIYIGQTIRPIETRFQQHQKRISKCRAIYNAIKKYGWNNFEKDWYECPDEDLNFDEELLIREMGTLSPYGYNLREGGGNCGKWSEESKQKLSESQRGDKHHMFGKTHSEETKRKNSESQIGKTLSDETKQKISEARLGKTLSDETKQKISESTIGEKHYRSRRVYQYDLDGTFVDSFGSSGEAARHLKRRDDGSSICRCARGERKTAHGFKWSYVKL